MSLIRLGLVHPSRLERDARLNLLGVEELLGQEGIPYQVVNPEEPPQSAAAKANLLLALDHGCLSPAEERGLARLAGTLPLVWTGIPRREADPGLLRVLGLERVQVDDSANLRLIQLSDHRVGAAAMWGKEDLQRFGTRGFDGSLSLATGQKEREEKNGTENQVSTAHKRILRQAGLEA